MQHPLELLLELFAGSLRRVVAGDHDQPVSGDDAFADAVDDSPHFPSEAVTGHRAAHFACGDKPKLKGLIESGIGQHSKYKKFSPDGLSVSADSLKIRPASDSPAAG